MQFSEPHLFKPHGFFNHKHMVRSAGDSTVESRLSGLVGTSINSPDNRESG